MTADRVPLRLRRGIDHGPQRRNPAVPGPQEIFLSSTADIAILGGAAGGGKTWTNCYDPLRYVSLRGARFLFVREWAKDIRMALWPEMEAIYPLLGGISNRNDLRWTFESGAVIEAGHLDGDYKKRYRGGAWAGIYFEELADIAEEPFWYLMSRCRTSVRGLRPYIRGTCNPDADSWLARFLAWWIDPLTGYAIPERAGRVRWMAKGGDVVVWAATRQKLIEQHPWVDPDQCKSVQFIPAKLADNAYLDASYRGNLLSQDDVMRARLLEGNWLARYEKGKIFRREWFSVVEDAPADVQWVRAWDLAATSEKDAETSSSYTAGVKIGVSPSTGRIYVGDLVYGRWDHGDVEDRVLKTAGARPRKPDDEIQGPQDGPDVPIWFCRERAGAGKSILAHYVRLLKGYTVDGDVETGEKGPRLGPLASQAKGGNVVLVRGEWNDRYLSAMERLPARPDDVGDASAAGFDRLVLGEHYSPAEVAQAFAEDAETAHDLSSAFDFSGSSRAGGW